MTACGGLDLIRDEVPRLKGIRHSAGAHADSIANADSAELVANQVSLHNGLFDTLAQTEQMSVTSGRLHRLSSKTPERVGAYGLPSYLERMNDAVQSAPEQLTIR
jgi:hypothetical protein